MASRSPIPSRSSSASTVVNPPAPARLGRLRREPRREALSTLEAAALVLGHLEAAPTAADALLTSLDRLMDVKQG